MKLQLDPNRTIETDFVEAVYQLDGVFLIEMSSGRTHQVDPIIYQTILGALKNASTGKTAFNY